MARTPAPSLSPGRKLAYSIVIVVVLLALLEGIARLLENRLAPVDFAAPQSSGWQTTFFGSIFDWNEPDPDLLWRFKPNLNNVLIKTNSHGLIADEIKPVKPEGTVRIMVLGDSSPAGLGLKSRTETFADILRRRLSVYAGDSLRFEMINASVPGYTSEQVRRFLETKGWSYQPDLLIVYCGNNDASFSGPVSDHDLMQAQSLVGLRQILSHSAFYRLLRDLLHSRRSDTGPTDNRPLVPRVSPERYGENLRAIADDAQDRGVPVIVLAPPVPRLWPAGLQFNIFRQMKTPDGRLLMPDRMVAVLGRQLEYCLDSTLIRYIYGETDPVTRAVLQSAFRDPLPPERAVTFWLDRARRQPTDPVARNNSGVAAWRLGMYTEADSLLANAAAVYRQNLGADAGLDDSAAAGPFFYNRGINELARAGIDTISWIRPDNPAYRSLDSALQLDYYSLRVKRRYIERLTSLPLGDNLSAISLQTLFAANGGERRFVDHCHPDAVGHRLIADTLLPEVGRLLGLEVSPARGTEHP